MAVVQYRPAGDLFGSMFDELMSPLSRIGRPRDMMRGLESEVAETEQDLRVVIDAPGMQPEDIDISLENNILTVTGERRPEWSEAEEGRFTWHLSERRYGKFSRSFVLPRGVDPERITARSDNGVLSISIPKSEKARRRRIAVEGRGEVAEVAAKAG